MQSQDCGMAGVARLRAALKGLAAGVDAGELVGKLSLSDGIDLLADWPAWARPDQAADAAGGKSWRTWLILGGRGAGKPRAGAEWVRAKVLGQDWAGEPAGRLALIADTL